MAASDWSFMYINIYMYIFSDTVKHLLKFLYWVVTAVFSCDYR